MPDRRRPASTYRLQLHPGFGFADAAGLADYLAGLGVTHVYLSPVLQAAPGSQHGYDVVDHSRLSADLGGHTAFTDMAERFHSHGLGVVVDIVPNHMAIPTPEYLAAQVWSVLAQGRDSPYAHWFDIDWEAQGGRLLMPILAGPAAECLSDLTVDHAPRDSGLAGGGPVLRYFDHVLPLRAGTEDRPLPDLLDAQHYRLTGWRRAATDLNYRRFFDVSSLIALRAEDPDVFTTTHAVVLGLLANGHVDGLRVDHLDGLADPRGYLDQLAKASGGAWVVVEKILTPGEELTRDLACAGTTGYDALGAACGLFVDPAGERALTEGYQRFASGPPGFAGVAEWAKRQTLQRALAAEVARLSRVLAATGEPATASPGDRASVLTELLAAFPIYRAYVVPGEPAAPTSVAVVEHAAGAARARLPARLHEALHATVASALGRSDEFTVRFQQTSGAVMAKGVEDTAFYRWPRLVSLNEVGGDPDEFGTGTAVFHGFAARVARDWPATMTTLSTHDTKRQEDVRARLAVLAEDPAEWAAEVTRWHERAVQLAGPLPDPDTEYLLWQTLAGAWPVSPQRLKDYVAKAVREAKTHTSWSDPDPAFEQAVLAFADAVLADATLTGRVGEYVARAAPDAESNALSAKLVQLTMPGVPDVYQGCELAGLALVDPDNRRPVDFARRRDLLARLDEWLGTAHVPGGGDPAVPGSFDERKLLVTALALRLRREHPDWFAGEYQPLHAEGPAAAHAVVFARGGHAITVVTRLPRGLRRSGGWRDTVLPLPEGDWHDVLTGTSVNGLHPRLAELMARLPVALLAIGPAHPFP